jgi:hypothetical protein
MENKVTEIVEAVVLKNKPIVSYYRSGDPTSNFDWVSSLTEINIINTKKITDEFIDICLKNKHRIFLHFVITGMGQTTFEPNIPSVKNSFFQLKKLINSGFPQKQILVVVNPIIQNENGLKALKLLLKVFTEFKELRLRFIRFGLLQIANGKNEVKLGFANPNIDDRVGELKSLMPYLKQTQEFYREYSELLKEYSSIISIDNGIEALIGIKELMAFGLKNEWFNSDGTRDKIIHYENGNKYKPMVNIISKKFATRCSNRCKLCPWKF